MNTNNNSNTNSNNNNSINGNQPPISNLEGNQQNSQQYPMMGYVYPFPVFENSNIINNQSPEMNQHQNNNPQMMIPSPTNE